MKKIFEWKIPNDYRNFTGHDDLPEGYRVYEDNRATGGIIIEACWNGHWEANPWNTRTLIRHLLVLIDTAKNNKALHSTPKAEPKCTCHPHDLVYYGCRCK